MASATAKLLPTELDFTSNGTDTNAKFTASASAFDFEGVAAADVDFHAAEVVWRIGVRYFRKLRRPAKQVVALELYN